MIINDHTGSRPYPCYLNHITMPWQLLLKIIWPLQQWINIPSLLPNFISDSPQQFQPEGACRQSRSAGRPLRGREVNRSSAAGALLWREWGSDNSGWTWPAQPWPLLAAWSGYWVYQPGDVLWNVLIVLGTMFFVFYSVNVHFGRIMNVTPQPVFWSVSKLQ